MISKRTLLLKNKVVHKLVLLALFIGGFGTQNASSAQARGFSATGLNRAFVTLSVDKTSFADTKDVIIHVKFTNPGNTPISILKWMTPLNGIESPIFSISRNGNPIAYLGKLVKRSPPTEDDYTTLLPGESLMSDVYISNYYDFSISGKYSIKYNVTSAELFKTGNSTDFLTSDAVEFLVEGRPNKAIGEAPTSPKVFYKSNAFIGCSGAQQTDIIEARNVASSYSANAASYLNGNRFGPRYSTWFGVYNPSRYASVTTNFNAIQNAMDNADMVFDCTCPGQSNPSGIYAFVYPGSPYTIYLCGAFASAPTSGTDSKAGTLIHEVSHFYVVAGTDDHAYGQSASQSLAINAPASAIQNADSHEYFAENTPALEPSYTFADVPYDAFAWAQIESIHTAGITGGCSLTPLLYCPENSVTRAEMAVFLLRGIHGSSYNPPAATGTVFTDIPIDGFAAAWVEELAAEGITGGCGNNLYCPDSTVTRDQMAVFLLKAKYTSGYIPPSVGGSSGFTDVSVEYWAASWIKQLAAESITGGCGSGNYCPGNPATRAQMAVFLQRTFGLP